MSTPTHKPRARYAEASMDLTTFNMTAHAHDFTPGKSRVVMVRKTDRRTFANSNTGEEPTFETVTKETVQTFRGNKIERKITSQKRDVLTDVKEDLSPQIVNVRSKSSSRVDVSRTPLSSNGTSTPQGMRAAASYKTKEVDAGATAVRSSYVQDDFAQECLKAHNEYRTLHNVAPLRLNKKLSRFSEEWAKHLVKIGRMEHRTNNNYGENIFYLWSSNPNRKVSGREAVDSWYEEIKDHVFGKDPSSLKTGHFTQVVWKESKELGVGVARSGNGQVFVVANYDPPGNFIGSFANNVPPVGGFSQEMLKKLEPQSEEEFAEEGLQCHNMYRKKHGAPLLKLNPMLTAYAQNWANTLVKEDKFQYSPNNLYGENLYGLVYSRPNGPEKPTAKDACQEWYNEGRGYQYGTEPRILKSGQFTQMLWKKSLELGMGRAKSKTGRWVIVASYNPRGNMVGEFAANVPRLI